MKGSGIYGGSLHRIVPPSAVCLLKVQYIDAGEISNPKWISKMKYQLAPQNDIISRSTAKNLWQSEQL